MLRMFNHLNQVYEKEKSLLIDTILKYQSRKESAKENKPKPSPSRKESAKEYTSKPSPKMEFLRTRQIELVKQIVTPTKQIRMQKNCM